MSAKIGIEGRHAVDADSGFGHLVLIFTDDVGKEYIIRGGPQIPIPPFGSIVVEVGVPIHISEDHRFVDGVELTRSYFGYRALDLGGKNFKEVRDKMLSDAAMIHDAKIDYDLFGPNSNSIIAYILARQNIEVADVLPRNRLIDGWGLLDPYPGIDDIDKIAKILSL